ncbi:MAG: InlB B-repeat-containing protein [Eubacteriales bacterium]|nr:InlB B-repeat-containing protein [Eubacteriales bacterium]
MKKRILAVLLIICTVLPLLPITASAAETGAMDNIPTKFDVEIDLCGRTSDINIKDSKTYYIYSSSNDPEWVWTKKIQVNGRKAAPHIFLDNVNIQVKEDTKTPAIELHGKASAYLYFINRDSKLTGATGRAAIQKNRSEGQLCVQVMKGTTVTCQGGFAGAGIGGSFATRDITDKVFNIDMYGHGVNMHFGSQTNPSLWSGTIIAKGGKYGAGIGGGQYVPAHDINITGGEINAHGAYGAAIGGGRWRHGEKITVTDATLKLTTGYNQYAPDAAVMGYGDLVYSGSVYKVTDGRELEDFVRNPSMEEDYKSIKVGSTKGKLVKLKVETRALTRNNEFIFFWNLYDILIPNANGRIDVQLLTLPYMQNYGWAINAMELELIDDPCNGKHDFGWVDRQSCHVWACRNMKCQARDPVAPESASNGKHASSGWNTEKHQLLCDVCGHVMETDTKAPVLEVLENGKIYTAEDVRDEKTLEGKPGAYTFTVRDPAASGETSSGIRSVTINGKEQTVGATYSLPAPDGGNNDAGNEYTVVATDNAGNQTTATVTVYRRHRVQVISPDGSKTYVDKLLAHNEYLILTLKLPEDAAVKLTDKDDNSTIRIDTTNATKPGCYFSSPNRYTQEQLAELDEQGEIPWTEYKYPDPSDDPDVIIIYIPEAHIDAAEYDKNASWYVYAKAENVKGTTYVSTPNLIADAEDPKAIDLSTGEELKSYGEYYGDLRFEIKEATPFTVWYRKTPDSTDYTVLLPDEDGYYTIPAVYEGSKEHSIYIEDTCGNKSYYSWLHVTWNYLIDVGEEGRYWETPTVKPLRISKTQYLEEELSKINIGVKSAHSGGKWMLVDVDWEIPETYDPQSPREQTFTVNGTVILAGTKDNEKNLSELDVVPRPGEEWKKNISVQVTVEGDPQYQVTVQDSENGSVTVVNATETAEDGTPLLCKGDLVMLSIAPDEGYMLSTLSVNGTPAAVAVGEDTYTFTQPEENVTITATFEKRNEHTVTFDANGGSEPDELPEEVTTAMPAKKVLHGSTYYLPECEFIAPEGKQFKAWQIDGTEYPVHAPVTVTADITVKALWEDVPPAPAGYAVTVTSGGNGTASAFPDKAVAGAEITLSATPKEGYHFKEWQVESPSGLVITDNKFTMPDGNVEVKAIFEKDAPPAPAEFTITFDGNGGTPSVGSMTTANQKLTSLPSASRSNHSFDGWYTEKSGGTRITTDTVFSANTTVYVHWTYTGGGSSGYSYYTIKATAGAGGSISPSGNVSVREGRDQTFTITPDTGYTVSDVRIDGNSVGAVESYTFENVGRTHTIEVIFMKANGNPQTGVFVDVAAGVYYEDAVDWAVESGITKGTDDTHFYPDGICTRAQAVTFLWRAAGSPEPETRTMPFTDVPVSSYYYDAVLWAVRENITKGTTSTTFSPDADCTRAQIVTFLWRCKK